MKNKSLLKSSVKASLAVVALLIFSSCNRGYGCPTNFSIDIVDVLKSMVFILF